MKRAIRMPSIEQFRSTVYNITKASRFCGFEDGEPIYKDNELPTLVAKGTVKIHGTNASVCYNDIDGLWAQSKKKIITPEEDNAGFAFFVQSNIDVFMGLFENVFSNYIIDLSVETITIYGEWAGCGIQKNVGVSKLNKSFYIFGIKITPENDEYPSYWLSSKDIFLTNHDNIFEINDFTTFRIEIDFNNPGLSQNNMVDMVQSVENECPVAKYFGVSGVGEGIVFETMYKNNIYRWKMKGDKHAGKSKVKIAFKIDDKKLQLILDIVESITPEWRLSQMYQETFDTLNGGVGDIKKIGTYLRSVFNDIIKEESRMISNANLIPKDINSFVAKKARAWFMKKLDQESGIK